MKNNSLQLLTTLYPAASKAGVGSQLLVKPDALRELFPQLSEAGFRSLLFLLAKKGLISTERLQGEQRVRITFQGIEMLKASFPALKTKTDWQGEWAVMIFISAPKHDRQFRRLRQLLLEAHAVSASRGVYFYPQAFPEWLMTECKQLYIENVIVVRSNQWLFGDQRSFFMQKFDLSSSMSALSGISRELSSVIAQKMEIKVSNHQSKKPLCLLFYRWWEIFAEDAGLLPLYFPQEETIEQILARWQRIYFA